MYVAGQSLRLYREARHKGTKVVVGQQEREGCSVPAHPGVGELTHTRTRRRSAQLDRAELHTNITGMLTLYIECLLDLSLDLKIQLCVAQHL